MMKLVCFALLIAAASAGKVDSESCGGSAKFIEADIEGCSGSGTCTITKEQATNIVVKFNHGNQITSGTYQIIATYLGFEITITDKNVCDGLDGCKHPGGDVTHNHVMSLSNQAPEVTASARLEIKSNNQLLICRKMQITIKK